MCCKKVQLNIFCSKNPCCLTIVMSNGSVIKKRITKKKFTTLCFCTKDNCIKLFAKFKNQTIYKKICLLNVGCQNVFVSFMFKKVISKIVFQTIVLTDLKYGLPVQNALLKFEQYK